MLADQLKLLRRKANLTQQQVADLLKIPRGTYTHYEIGKREPNLETLQKLAALFGVTIDYLIYDEIYHFTSSLELRESRSELKDKMLQLYYQDQIDSKYLREFEHIIEGYSELTRRIEPWEEVIEQAEEYGISPRELKPVLDIIKQSRKNTHEK